LNFKLEEVSGGSAGLAFALALMLTRMTQYGVRVSAELESQMTAVERIIEYSKLEQEADLESSADNKPDKEWPKKGEIKIVNMSVFYDNSLKPVLKNICCFIRGGQKIGIIGRTGAGKSSLLGLDFFPLHNSFSFMRFYEDLNEIFGINSRVV
jgi:ABC-type multidrug transport system fused ATPase/permease subunit